MGSSCPLLTGYRLGVQLFCRGSAASKGILKCDIAGRTAHDESARVRLELLLDAVSILTLIVEEPM